MKTLKVVSFILVLALVMAAAVMPVLAAASSTNASFTPGVLKLSVIRIGSFTLVSSDNGTRKYVASVGDFTVTDGRGSGQGWNVRIWADGLYGGQLTIEGISGEAAPHSDAFDASYTDAQHGITAYPSSFISVPAGQGKGSYYFTGSEIMLTLAPGEYESILSSVTVAIEVASNTF